MKIEITSEFSIGDTIYFIDNHKIKSGTLYKIEVVVEEQTTISFLFVRSDEYTSSVVRPHQAFNSRQQLIDQL
jgi:hypothetical protein